ncbi:MAG: conjugal transfer protein TraF [Legionellales bacterium]|nr:conjugal transfer protein TraF [Legionellales bacterium]
MVFKRYILLFLIGVVLNSYAAIGMVEDLQQDVAKNDVALAKIRELNTKDVSSFIENHKLYFIYGHDCPACHRMIGDVRSFIDRFKFDFEAIAIGGSLPEFPDSKVDNSYIVQKLKDFKVVEIPLLVFINNDSKTPVGKSVGVKSEDELIDWLTGLVEIYRRHNLAKNISANVDSEKLLAEMVSVSEGDEGNV